MTTQTATAAPVEPTTPAGAATESPAAVEAPAGVVAEPVAPSAEELAAKAAADAKAAEEAAAKAEKAERLAEVKRLAAQTRARYLETDAAKRARAEADKARADADKSVSATQAELAELRARLAEAEKAPWKWAKSKGLTAQQVAEEELSENTDDAKFKELSARLEASAAAANKKAEEAEAKAQAIIDANNARAERAARVEAWETAKSSAVQTFDSAKTELADLHAWVDKQASRSGGNRVDILVEEMLGAVQRIKANPQTAPFAAEYTDAEILAAINARYDGFAKLNAPAPAAAVAPTSIASATQVTAPPEAQAKDPKPGATQASTGTAQKPAPTLTNTQASEASGTSFTKPDGFDTWPERKANAWLAEQLRNGTLTRG